MIADLAQDLRAAVPGLLFALEEGRTFRSEPGWTGHVPDSSRSPEDEAAVTVQGVWAEVLAGSREVVKFLAAHEDADPDELVARASALLAGRAEVTHSVARGRKALLEAGEDLVGIEALELLRREKLPPDHPHAALPAGPGPARQGEVGSLEAGRDDRAPLIVSS